MSTGILNDPILLDEVNYPLRKVFVNIQNRDTDIVANQLQAIARKYGNLFQVIKLANTENGGIGVEAKDICHDTVDMRDSFRFFTDNQNRTEVQSLICLSGSDEKKARCIRNLPAAFSRLTTPVSGVTHYNYLSTYDKLGNVVVSPPTPSNRYGIIFLGSQKSSVIQKILQNSGLSNSGIPLEFSWMPSCGELSPTQIERLNSGLQEKRRMYCSSEQTYNFSKIPLKRSQDSISSDFESILNQFRRQKKVDIFTGWLEVGHIDEILSFIPFPRNESTHGFKVLLASPQKFVDLWEIAANRITGGDTCLFRKKIIGAERRKLKTYWSGKKNTKSNNQLLGLRKGVNDQYEFSKVSIGINFEDTICDIKIKDFTNKRYQSLIQFNSWLQANILNTIKKQLMQELEIKETDIIDVPILYVGPDELFSYVTNIFGMFSNSPIENVKNVPAILKELFDGAFGVYHLSNNFINSLYSNKYIVAPKLQDNIGVINYLRDEVIREGSIEKIYDDIDEWTTIKYQHGGLHCYTTEYRDLSSINEVLPLPTNNVRGGGRRSTRKKLRKTQKRNMKSRRV